MSDTYSAEAIAAAKNSVVDSAGKIGAALEDITKKSGATITLIGQITGAFEKTIGASGRLTASISAVGTAVTSMSAGFQALSALPKTFTDLSSAAGKLANTAATAAATAAEKAHAVAVAASSGELTRQAGVLNANIIAKAKDMASNLTSAASEKAHAVAAGASTAAITLKTVAMHAGAVAAGLLGAAMKLLMGPIGAVIAVVTLLVVGIMAIVSAVNKHNAAYNEAGETIEAYKEKNEELKNSLQESTDSYRKNDAAAQGSAAVTRNMASAVVAAAAGYDKTSEGAAKMQAKVKMLNDACEGLNLTFDETTGELSQTAAEIEAYISISEQAARKSALSDHMTELNGTMSEAQAEMILAEMEMEKWSQQVESGEMSARQFEKRQKEMQETIAELGETVAETAEDMARYEAELTRIEQEEIATRQALMIEQEDAIRALADEYHYSYDDIIAAMEEEGQVFSEWTADNLEMLEENKAAVEGYAAQWGVSTDEILARCDEQGISFEELADIQQAAIGRLQNLYGSLADSATDMFSQISTESELSVEDMTANLLHNQQAVAEWSENIAALAEMGIDDGLLQTLMEAGPESAGYVKAIVDGGEEEIMKLSDAYAAGADTANEALKTSLGDVDITPEVMDMVTQTEDSLVKQIKESNFPGIGKSVGEGYAKGIEETEAQILAGSRQMAKITTDTAKNELGIHSPSKVFTDIGQNVVQGLTKGIGDKLTSVSDAASKVVNALDIADRLYQTGGNAMQGFNDGLWNMASRVYSTAQTIANNVASTINRALRIHSPSRLLRESGRYTMEGFDLGMQDMESGIVATVRGIAGRVTHEMQAAAMSGNGVDAVYQTDVSYSDAATTSLLEKLIAAVRDGQVIRLDTGALVGATAGAYDVSLGNTKHYSERWGR